MELMLPGSLPFLPFGNLKASCFKIFPLFFAARSDPSIRNKLLKKKGKILILNKFYLEISAIFDMHPECYKEKAFI